MRNENQRANYLVKNTIIFTIGNIATKFISFFLVPLYTNVLSTSEYGIIDLVTTICSFLAPIIILNIGESVMRFCLDREADHAKIVSIGILIYMCSLVIGLFIIPINSIFPKISKFSFYIYFYTLTCAGSQLFLCYLRGKELLAHYTMGGVIQTLILICLNIIFLLKLHMGISGYFLAMIISSLISMLYAIFVGKIWKLLPSLPFDKKLFFQMVKYSAVLIPNTFMWWIMNASDRIMVTIIVDVAANGIYAISYKLPTLVSTFTTIFNQAWSYSAIKEEGAKDETEFNNRVLNTLISITMLMGIGILTIAKPFLKLYVTPAYYEAWKYIPFLTAGCVYLALGTFLATSYTVHKDSFGYLFSAVLGAIFNIVFNLILIPNFKVYGAAIATCVSYVAVFVFRSVHTRKYIKYKVITREFCVGSFLMLNSGLFMFLDSDTGQILQVLLLLITIILYTRAWLPIVKKFLKLNK